jgi:hypothetical protein
MRDAMAGLEEAVGCLGCGLFGCGALTGVGILVVLIAFFQCLHR